MVGLCENNDNISGPRKRLKFVIGYVFRTMKTLSCDAYKPDRKPLWNKTVVHSTGQAVC